MKILGIEIDRKTDILAFTAFLLSLSTLTYQGVVRLQGPQVHLLPPRQIVLYAYSLGDLRYLNILAQMAYVNSGQPGFNSVVIDESVTFPIEDKKYTQVWHEFVSYSDEDDKLIIKDRKSVGAFVINAASAVTHETSFAPAPYSSCVNDEDDCDPGQDYLQIDDFVLAFQALLIAGSPITDAEIRFTFHATTLNDGNKRAECNVRLTGKLLQRLRNDDKKTQWVSLRCIE